MSEQRIEIRASSLPSVDCWRRWAAENRSLHPVLEKHGFKINADRPNAGSMLGTAAHEGLGALMQARLDGYSVDPISHAMHRLHKDMAETPIESLEDKTTPDRPTAIAQVERMLQEIIPKVKDLKPAKVEFAVEAAIDATKGLYVTGHPDLFDCDGAIHDWKFGKGKSAYDSQLGCYSLMLRSDPSISVSALKVWWVPRRSMKSKLWGLQTFEFDKYQSEELAHHVIEEASERIEKFRETGDPWAFSANPNNMLCSQKHCPAWGTNFCPYGRKDDSQED